MGQTQILMKLIAFIALTSAFLLVVAMDANFKEFVAYQERFIQLEEALSDNPLDELGLAQEGNPPDKPEDVNATSGRNCWIAEWCPDLGVLSDINDFFTDVGNAIWGFAQMIWGYIERGINLAKVGLEILALAVTFTIPGIPFLAQAMLWVLVMPVWTGIFFIALKAVMGAIGGVL